MGYNRFMSASDRFKLSNIVNEETLFPLSVVILLIAGGSFVQTINSMAKENQKRVDLLETKREMVDIRLFDRLRQLEVEVSSVKANVGKANGKLDIVVELMSDKNTRN